MHGMRMSASLLAMTCLVAGTAAWAQRAGEITFYSEIAFRGRSYVVTGPREFARVPFTVRSARIARGDKWELCTAINYQGRCNMVDQDQGNVAWTVASARPARSGGGGGGPGGPGAPGREQSLRGMGAQFFVQPSNGGRRVPSCTSGAANCAAEAADRFCVSRGWTTAKYESQETVAGRIYLTDVLCTRAR